MLIKQTVAIAALVALAGVEAAPAQPNGGLARRQVSHLMKLASK